MSFFTKKKGPPKKKIPKPIPLKALGYNVDYYRDAAFTCRPGNSWDERTRACHQLACEEFHYISTNREPRVIRKFCVKWRWYREQYLKQGKLKCIPGCWWEERQANTNQGIMHCLWLQLDGPTRHVMMQAYGEWMSKLVDTWMGSWDAAHNAKPAADDE